MSSPNAVCVPCGAFKKSAQAACPACGFEPKSEYEVARALILSQKFTADETTIGRTADELRTIAADIRVGRPYRFDPQEQERVVDQYRAGAVARSQRSRLGFLRWLVPITLILGLLALLLWSR